MSPRRSHTLAPLTRMISNKSKFEWGKVEQDAFEKIKWTMARNIYQITQILMKYLKFIPMPARSN